MKDHAKTFRNMAEVREHFANRPSSSAWLIALRAARSEARRAESFVRLRKSTAKDSAKEDMEAKSYDREDG